MKKLIRQKRKQLILVSLVTLLTLAGAYNYLIRSQQEGLHKLAAQKAEAQQKHDSMKRAVASADDIDSQLGVLQGRLNKLEDKMASGDLYSWAINTVRQFKLSYKLDIPQFSQIDGPRDVTLIPKFPYQQASLSVAGTGQFQDLGRFIADFENDFPHMRILNLVLEPESTLNESSEKLSFKMDIVALVRPNAS